MKIRFARRPGEIWEARLVPETRGEKLALQKIADVRSNNIHATYSGRDKHNPLGFTLNLTRWVTPRSRQHWLLVSKPKRRKR